MCWSLRWIGKETLVSFEEGRVGKEVIIWVGGVVDVRLSCGPADRRLGLEVIDFVRVISRGKCYGVDRIRRGFSREIER